MSPSPLAIVAARHDDIPLVQHLAHEIWHRHYPGIITIEQIEYMLERGYSTPALARFVESDEGGLELAQRDGATLGFAAWYRGDPPDELKLDKLYVLPERHREGVGRALIEHVADRARAFDCSTLVLYVNRANVGAIRAYERCGFAVRSRRDAPIGAGFVMEDYIMARRIANVAA